MIGTIDTVESGVPRIPVGEWIETGFDWLLDNAGDFFDALSDLVDSTINGLTDFLQWPPALVMVAVLALFGLAARGWKLGLGAALVLTAVVGMDQWDNAMETLAVVLVASFVALLVGVPIGVAAARWDRFSSIVRPVMDLMQTMPAFVWLVPVVMLFGVGVSAALVATVIFALPPGVRLTELGIRQVDAEIVEAG
ncbi:MAG TPA: ABC transporter permease subunit, partial [Aeromicrobium sp.]|nr:ABC transporter permease subunit [Aeromicrobium sp.]